MRFLAIFSGKKYEIYFIVILSSDYQFLPSNRVKEGGSSINIFTSKNMQGK